MKVSVFVALILGFWSNMASAQDDCLAAASLIKIDSQWERALLETNVEWLEEHLADEFIWVHNHAGQVDTKQTLLAPARVARTQALSARSRVQSEVEARIVGSTGLVTGFTVVDRGAQAKRYSFMRTYAVVSNRCVLLGNHTMLVPEN